MPLRKEEKFDLTPECERTHESLKKSLAKLQVLTRPLLGETLYLYLVVSEEEISVVLIREPNSN